VSFKLFSPKAAGAFATSGSGKTRRMLECFTRYWGFYFVAAQDINEVGVRDLQEALDDGAEGITDLRSLPPKERADPNKENRKIASTVFKKLLAARMVIFELFLELAIKVDGVLEEKHKRIWLLFQLFDNLDPRARTEHPFLRIMRNCLNGASADSLDILVGRFDDIRTRHSPLLQSCFIIGLDEAQAAVRMYPSCFVSSSGSGTLQSIVRDIVRVFTDLPIKLVVSGTGLSLGDLHDSAASRVSKLGVGVKVSYKLGMFNTWSKLKKFFERYIPTSILESPSGYRLQQRIQEYLLGR
jgi:hypothetical protein